MGVEMGYRTMDLLKHVVANGGSDLHLTAGLPPMMRMDGILVPIGDAVLTPADTRQLAYAIMTEPYRKAFENDWEADLAYSLPESGRFRVNCYFQRGSVGAAFRFVPEDISSFEDLGLPVTTVADLSMLPRGLVIVTGPTGSGKSTTLASMVDYINEHREVHIVTIEDPIEYLHHHKNSMVNQREAGTDTHGFADALKHVLRQDPDVIMIGEARDLETMRAALTAAETGHLVLTSLHTQDAVQTIDRIIDMFPSSQQRQIRTQLAATVQGVISQQLLASSTGDGRVLAAEVMISTPAVANVIREGKTHQIPTIMQTGQQFGMITMDQSLADLVRSGRITMEDAESRAVEPKELAQLLDNRT
jgi:twitching motility protein PilT